MAEATEKRLSSKQAKFVKEMKAAGYKVDLDYKGRYWYEGPAVVTDDRSEALAATTVACQWDNMGLGWVIYPKA